MDGPLMLQELETRQSGKWVLLADINSEPGVLRRGRVLWHSADQDECCAKAAELPASNVRDLYLGDWSAEDEPAPML